MRRREQQFAVAHGRIAGQDRVDRIAFQVGGGVAHQLRNAGERAQVVVDNGLTADGDDAAIGGELVDLAAFADGAVGELAIFRHFVQRRGFAKLHAAGLLEVGQVHAAAERQEGARSLLVAHAKRLVRHVRKDVREVRSGVQATRAGVQAQHIAGAFHQRHAARVDTVAAGDFAAEFQQAKAHELTGAVFQLHTSRVGTVHQGVLDQRTGRVALVLGDGDVAVGSHLFVLFGEVIEDGGAGLFHGQTLVLDFAEQGIAELGIKTDRTDGGGDFLEAGLGRLLGAGFDHNRSGLGALIGALFGGRVARYGIAHKGLL